MVDALDARLDAGTYEVLRGRLARSAAELAERAQALYDRRVGEFGGGELRLVGTGRLTTGRACLPQDLTAAGGLLLLGTRPGGAPDAAVSASAVSAAISASAVSASVSAGAPAEGSPGAGPRGGVRWGPPPPQSPPPPRGPRRG
ncbi:DNA repair ATPase, partial [Kitasatospora sp. NPDC059803]|uniref:DNA repair ATPase n=1 Tax=Kitasatospora sp. NPDC059803 TaxID=3346953 RepID=UPI00364A14B1